MGREPKWLAEQSSRRRADDADRRKAKNSAGEYQTVSNSGAGKNKMDLVGICDSVETKFTDAQSFRLKASDIQKMVRDAPKAARRGERRFPVMQITMQTASQVPVTVIVMLDRTYDLLRETFINADL